MAERICSETAPTVSLRIGAVLGPHADPRIAKATLGYRTVVPAARGCHEALQFLDEEDAATALHAAGGSAVTGVINVAPADWMTAADIARVARSRAGVVRLPRRLLLAGAEAGFRLRALPFGADRAVMVTGPLALDPARAAATLGWRATRSSAQVLAAALSAQ